MVSQTKSKKSTPRPLGVPRYQAPFRNTKGFVYSTAGGELTFGKTQKTGETA